jgi:Cu-Zn family superoxide dismutase
MAIAELRSPTGELVGVATLTEGADGVTIAVNMSGMPPGSHALHIHASGHCEGPDFASAHGHFNPQGRKHGFKSPDGPHAGDLPNIVIGADGVGAIVVTAPQVTLGPGKHSLLGEGGTAIMIHMGPDDHLTDPAGNAGARIACGVIRGLP